MAHPSREKHFQYLRDKLGNVPFSIDDGRGLWGNAKRAWEMHDPDADYHVVIQDDAYVCDNFKERAEEILSREIPSQFAGSPMAYSFYFGKRYNLAGDGKKGLRDGFVIKNGMYWGVAMCLPTKKIKQMLEFAEKQTARGDDTRIGRFCEFINMKVYYPIPSLVDHRADEHSLVGDPGKGRVAFQYIDAKK